LTPSCVDFGPVDLRACDEEVDKERRTGEEGKRKDAYRNTRQSTQPQTVDRSETGLLSDTEGVVCALEFVNFSSGGKERGREKGRTVDVRPL
jgi:hypothetical protein